MIDPKSPPASRSERVPSESRLGLTEQYDALKKTFSGTTSELARLIDTLPDNTQTAIYAWRQVRDEQIRAAERQKLAPSTPAPLGDELPTSTPPTPERNRPMRSRWFQTVSVGDKSLFWVIDFCGVDVTIYATDTAMRGAVNIRLKRGFLCVRLPLRIKGVWYRPYAYFSPDSTPNRATWIIGSTGIFR